MSLALFDELQPSGGQIQSSATLRNQFNSLFQGDMYPLKAMAQDIQDNTVKVYSSNVNSYYQQVWVKRTQPLDFTEGNSPPIIAPTSNNRITLLTINSAGTLEWNYGTEAASPSAPNAPIGKLPLVQVYQRLNKSTIYELADDNGIDCYIIKDVRPVLMPIFYPENVKEIIEGYDVNDDDLIDDTEILQIIDDYSNSIVSERVLNVAAKIWRDDLLISGLPGNLKTDFFNVSTAINVDKYNALFDGGLGTLFEDPIVAHGGYKSSGGNLGIDKVFTFTDNDLVEHTLTFEDGLLVGYASGGGI